MYSAPSKTVLATRYGHGVVRLTTNQISKNIRRTLSDVRVSYTQQQQLQSRVAQENELSQFFLPNGLINYYELLGVNQDADSPSIKMAYRAMAKQCHPDYMGDTGHRISVLLNEAYMILSNEDSRKLYDVDLFEALSDEDIAYTGQSLSEWLPQSNPLEAKNEDPNERRAIFVDELRCIGCKNCTFCAANTFIMEPVDGRARAVVQWKDSEDALEAAIYRDELPPLEYLIQKKLKKTYVANLMTGAYVVNVFVDAKKFARDRRERARLMQRKYSPAEEARKKHAVEDILQSNLSWFSDLFEVVIPNMPNWQVDEKIAKGKQFFRRKSAIPRERSLVPLSKK
eukprot:TRINITY_DN4246_c0_g1_i1.p1 TRINITY_DN4246_c0_g1~~TRINITY_DN4246_c0_g1_i1.p1  ORF type:complete len:341 (-),score=31.14 TRINITY_DN4246_c0_g1_i1:599-1621(-)